MDNEVLIIYAHPKTTIAGNCQHILEAVKKQLGCNSKQYKLLDLYTENFNPVMSASEHYVSGGKQINPDIERYQCLFKKSKYIVLIHPIWWGGMPAILKGFFDRLLTPGFGYKYIKGIPHKLFKDKKAVVFQTSGGPWWWTNVVQNARARYNIKNDILGFVGIESHVLLLTNARAVTEKQKERIRKLTKRGLKKLWQ
ncbi:MAG: NAD(P)H-dependent oxidoreductase [Candidatus Nomurabacteria bacterium]|nr:NAD(P)H-dependent oxidoreductase [Candidatus Nomurabacteria bacterium]USN87341.1 MAG: NAD(P)H-dependent oxidoreductase [Candidatus Nomurabacteria bacterium]